MTGYYAPWNIDTLSIKLVHHIIYGIIHENDYAGRYIPLSNQTANESAAQNGAKLIFHKGLRRCQNTASPVYCACFAGLERIDLPIDGDLGAEALSPAQQGGSGREHEATARFTDTFTLGD